MNLVERSRDRSQFFSTGLSLILSWNRHLFENELNRGGGGNGHQGAHQAEQGSANQRSPMVSPGGTLTVRFITRGLSK